MNTHKDKGVKKYKLIISCPDCSNGQDPLGCFDGGVSIEEFEDLKEAIKVGEDRTNNSVWEYEIKGATKAQMNKAFRKLYGYDYE